MKRFNVIFIIVCFSIVSGFAFAQDRVPGEIIIKYRENIREIPAEKNKSNKKAKFKKRISHHAKAYLYKSANDQDADEIIEHLQSDPEVEYAEPNYYVGLSQTVSMQSEVVSQSYVNSLSGGGTNYLQTGIDFGVAQSWALHTNQSQYPLVAIIDTGVDYNHSVFTGSGVIWVNPGEISGNSNDDDANGYRDDVRGWNFINDTNNPMDDQGHGTHVAGIILGLSQDIFSSPLAPAKIRILPIKFLDSSGTGTTADAVSAIYYAVNMGAKVINNSWGGNSYSQSLHDALTYAHNNGVFLSAAAGNFSRNNDSQPLYPSNLAVPSQIAVAATEDDDTLASFSSFGQNSVHMGAPGVYVLSTYPGNSYRYISGTSMATPIIAGLAAIVAYEAPNLSGYQIKNLILNSSVIKATLSNKVYTSARVDSYDTVLSAQNSVGVATYSPNYSAAAPASSNVSIQQAAGCGTVGIVAQQVAKNMGGPMGPFGNVVMGFLFLIPLMVWFLVRSKWISRERRKYDRFAMHSKVKIRVGGRQLEGDLLTISEGGVSFAVDSLIAQGGNVDLMIYNQQGSEQIQVEGKIVWSRENRNYGVQFSPLTEGIINKIRAWTLSCVRQN